MVRGQLVEFCGCSSDIHKKRLCYLGNRLNDIITVCGDVTSEANANTFFIIHAGTNYVKANRLEELLEKYRIIKQYKLKIINNIVIISSPSRKLVMIKFCVTKRSAPTMG